MSENLSRRLFAIEMWLLGVPFLLAIVVGAALAILEGLMGSNRQWLLLTVPLLWLVGMSWWKLSRAFTQGGVAALSKMHTAWWIVAVASVILPAAYGLVLLVWAEAGVPYSPVSVKEDPFGVGPQSWVGEAAPWLFPGLLVVPLLHLHLEQRYRVL